MTRTPRTRRHLLLALLLVLVGGLLLGPQAAPALADPCEDVPGPAKEYCNRQNDGDDSNDGPPTEDPTGLTPECKAAPVPATPGRGDGSWALEAPEKAPAPLNPKSKAATGHLYEQYGLAGFTWHTYDLACESPGDVLEMMNTDMSSSWGSRIFSWSTWWTTLAIGLQEQATSDGYISDLFEVMADATGEVTDAIYRPWIGLSVLVLGVGILYSARRRDLPGATKSVAWAMMIMALTSVAFSSPAALGKIADDAIVETVGRVQQGVAGDLTSGSKPGVAQGNMLARGILYDGWLRGEFGDSDSKVATKYGMQLYDAQTLTWAQSRLPDEERKTVIEDKQKAWADIAAKVKEEDPEAYEYLTGRAGGRLSAGVETALGATPANLYSFAASVLLISARLIIPTALIFLPAIAPIAIHRRMSGTVRSLGEGVGAALINAPLFAVAAAIDVLLVKALFNESSPIPSWFAVVLLWILTVMIWVITKPLRRLNAMISPNHHWFGDGIAAGGKAKAAVGGAALGYLKGRLTARQIGRMVNGKGTRKGQDGADEAEDGTLADDLDQHESPGRPTWNDFQAGYDRENERPDYATNAPWDYEPGWRAATGEDQDATPDAHTGTTTAPGDLFVPVPTSGTAAGAPVPATAPDAPETPTAPPVVGTAPPPARSGSTRSTPDLPAAAGELGTAARADGGHPSTPQEPPTPPAPEGDRPMPRPAPEIIDEDGARVFVIYNPTTDAFGRADDGEQHDRSTPQRDEESGL